MATRKGAASKHRKHRRGSYIRERHHRSTEIIVPVNGKRTLEIYDLTNSDAVQ